ncbi:conjugal transfer protein MobC [Chitinophaga barathri]|uniref:Conjugal transfer protein TraG n=1 Tax=Chitinophaga barathri TaxID=1647451 RepID=A0A3N4MCQ5_9BACT|nr:conjugal transfer protein MobC [Chitinophaga barathri]RPD39307.1 conjugal transfer protein TraG [Chitinophaga barathri]
MAHQTGENEQALRKILDMTRFISIVILILHFYYHLYTVFELWGLTSAFGDRLLQHVSNTSLFRSFHFSKLVSLAFLGISLLGARGRKSEKLNYQTALAYLISGLILYFASYFALYVSAAADQLALLYITCSSLGFLLCMSGGTLLSRIIKSRFSNKNIFNHESETFPQQEERLDNEYSINLPMKYRLKNKWRTGWLNIIAPFRTSLVSGSAGSAKTSGVLRFFISQGLAKPTPFTMLVYDFKFPDLSLVAYNHFLKNKHRFPGKPDCIFINIDDPSRSHRGNPLEPGNMLDITDAIESARTILLGLNKQWRTKQGDFFVESAVNFVTAAIWFLRKYRDGIYCTLPHVIEFIQLEYDDLFSLLQSGIANEVMPFVNPFLNAYLADVMEQLEGQIASAKIALARLASPQLYYVLTGSDFNLQINDPQHPRILCLGNNPQKTQIYGAVLSLFTNRVLKVINKKNKLPCMVHLDEFPTLEVDILPTCTTGRANLNAVVLGLQSVHQLRREYGKEMADVIMSIAGNLIAGQETGDTAKQLSEQIGKIMQERESLSISDSGTSVSRSKQLDYAVPPSKISQLSSGQFVGVLSDLPAQKVELKAFDCELMTDYDAINQEEAGYQQIPIIRQVDPQMIQANYQQVIQDIKEMAEMEISQMLADPRREHLVIRK